MRQDRQRAPVAPRAAGPRRMSARQCRVAVALHRRRSAGCSRLASWKNGYAGERVDARLAVAVVDNCRADRVRGIWTAAPAAPAVMPSPAVTRPATARAAITLCFISASLCYRHKAWRTVTPDPALTPSGALVSPRDGPGNCFPPLPATAGAGEVRALDAQVALLVYLRTGMRRGWVFAHHEAASPNIAGWIGLDSRFRISSQ